MIKSTSEADIAVAKALRYMLKVTNICPSLPKTSTVSEAFCNSETVSFRTFFKRTVRLFFPKRYRFGTETGGRSRSPKRLPFRNKKLAMVSCAKRTVSEMFRKVFVVPKR